jgi:L-seryl-tRNA(Ser) seleniumtransferase
LDNYPAAAAWPERLNALREELADLKDVNLSIEPDLAGRVIERLGVRFDSVAAARTFVAALRAGDPAIYSRNHLLDEGLVLFDLREVQAQDLPLLGARLRTLLGNSLESVQQEQ